MEQDLEKEIRAVYIAFFVTVIAGLVPTLWPYAAAAFGLQWFFVLTRYMNVTEPMYRSHALNYILGVGTSLLMGALITLQVQYVFKAFVNPLAAAMDNFETARSVPGMIIMMGVEAIVAFIFPIIMVSRGFYLLSVGRPAFLSSRETPQHEPSNVSQGPPRSDRRPAHGTGRAWLASAVLADGRVVKFELPMDGRPRTIGRSTQLPERTADLVLDDESVSRPHARVESRDGVVWISDLGSTNHTYVNDKLVQFDPVVIHLGDRVQLGLVKFTISAL